jgi:neuron navigator 2
METEGSQVWFTDLWNYSIVPYLREAVREVISVCPLHHSLSPLHRLMMLLLQLYGRRAPWEDPADWVIETYPWPQQGEPAFDALLRLRPEDVGYDWQGANAGSSTGSGKACQGAQQSDAEGDPLVGATSPLVNNPLDLVSFHS